MMLMTQDDREDNPARRVRIADAGDTYNYALAAVYDKGYKVFLYPHPCDDEKQSYWAIASGREFKASDPLELLGLIGIWERFGDNWHQEEIPDYLDQLFERTFPDDDYASLDENSFQELVEELHIFFEAIGEPMPTPLTRTTLAKFMSEFSRKVEDRANES
jgi:hypothetical protein